MSSHFVNFCALLILFVRLEIRRHLVKFMKQDWKEYDDDLGLEIANEKELKNQNGS